VTSKVLVVDDEEAVRRLEARLLSENGFDCRLAADVAQARGQLQQEPFDLALVDVNMPGVSGLDLIRYVADKYPETATVMVTGVDDRQVANAAIELGAYGYLIKPFEPNELLINVANALRRRDLEADNRAHRERLEQLVEARTAELRETLDRLRDSERDLRSSQEETVIRLARAAEARDNDTGQHIHRMSRYCELLARRCGLSAERCEQIRLASMLHDVGKIGVPDHVLLKPGPLTPQELSVARQHVEIGYRTLSGSKSSILQLAAAIALTHHEHFDGSGYSSGLAGESIPLEGRIAAIGDVFDALTSPRVYKPALAIEEVVKMLKDGRCRHFDPRLVDLFLEPLDEVLLIKDRYSDHGGNTQSKNG
jgi:putative two-component system response regulator